MLKEGEQLLLDDISVDELCEKLKVPILPIESSPWGILDGLESLAADPIDIIHC